MTQNQKLDEILNAYLYAEKFRLSKDKNYQKFTFEFILKSEINDLEEWEHKFLKERLFDDGYLIESGIGRGEPFLLTNLGKKFIQSGGYVKHREQQTLSEEIQIDTLKTNLFSRRISILSIVVGIISVLVAIFAIIYSRN